MNLAELYNRVTAKRPELEVACWKWSGNDRTFGVMEDIAAALILARWVEGLPVGVMLRKRINHAEEVWTVQGFPSSSDCIDAATPIEALAAFYLGEQ